MADRNSRILSSIGKVEKARFNCRAFGTFLFLFSLGLALHARSSSIELKLPIGLFDSGLHNGYTLIFGPAAILLVMIAAYFQRKSFVSLYEKVHLDITNANLASQLTELEKRELHGPNGFFAWLSDIGPFAAAAICAVTITWVFGDFQYPYVNLEKHPRLVAELEKSEPNIRKRIGAAKEPILVNVFEPYTMHQIQDPIKTKKLSASMVWDLLDKQERKKHNLKDNYQLLFLGPSENLRPLYSPWHDKVDRKNYSTMPSIDRWHALGHLLATIATCVIAVCVAIPQTSFEKLRKSAFRFLKKTLPKSQSE